MQVIKIMGLQPVLEVSVSFVKKINKLDTIQIQSFNVIATANTKAFEDGKFILLMFLTSVFVKISVTFEQKYPSVKIENKILNNTLKSYVNQMSNLLTS